MNVEKYVALLEVSDVLYHKGLHSSYIMPGMRFYMSFNEQYFEYGDLIVARGYNNNTENELKAPCRILLTDCVQIAATYCYEATPYELEIGYYIPKDYLTNVYWRKDTHLHLKESSNSTSEFIVKPEEYTPMNWSSRHESSLSSTQSSSNDDLLNTMVGYYVYESMINND